MNKALLLGAAVSLFASSCMSEGSSFSGDALAETAPVPKIVELDEICD